MKNLNIYLSLCCAILLFSCGGGGNDEVMEPEVNGAPTIPTQIYPLNNTLCIDNTINFQWNASTDPENNNISYKVEISDTREFSNLMEDKTVNGSNSIFITLEKGKAFFWRVKAIDTKNAESNFSSTSQFITEGTGFSNHVPFAPNLINPIMNAEIENANTTMRWSAMDVDKDPIRFDVYLDTTNPPIQKVSADQLSTDYAANNLNVSTTYYWKVVVKDINNAQSIGQTWSFITK
jgi:hypothetical protein